MDLYGISAEPLTKVDIAERQHHRCEQRLGGTTWPRSTDGKLKAPKKYDLAI
ncbi:MAG: hypothetical protein ACRD3Q_01280 [Terriglobales bacterium]